MQIMTNIFSIIVVILGWIIVHLLSEKRERRKELRLIARETVEKINIIEKLSIEYHCNSERNENNEKDIKFRLAEIDDILTLLHKKAGFQHTISFFRSSITMNNFQSAGFTTQQDNSEIVYGIIAQASALRIALYGMD